jgi:Plasmid encoded RepA protein
VDDLTLACIIVKDLVGDSHMGTIHKLIEARGRRAALDAAADNRERHAIEAAAAYMAEEQSDISFLFSGWAQAALPHRRIADDAVWRVETEHVTLLVEPGRRPLPGGENLWVGVPYGSRARLIMLYLQSEALRTGSRDVELGRSLSDWLGRLGIPVGGKSYRDVREQASRISRCRLSFHIQTGNRTGLINQNILDTAMFMDDRGDQGNLFVETATLSEHFFAQLKKHPVPIEESAISAINNNSMALDVYCWLAYRLHALQKPKSITWKALRVQFSPTVKQLFHFRAHFKDNLALALAVYPAARVEESDNGLTLFPSSPPVAPKGQRVIGTAP